MKGTLLLLSSASVLLQGTGGCPEKCLCHPSSSSVDCRGQGLAEIPPDLPTWTLTLLLQDNQIHWLPALAFRSTPLLTTLNLSNNSLSNLASNAFYGLWHLQVLNLTKNSLLSLESNLAHALPRLKELDLSFNNLSHLPTSLDEPWKNLTVFAVRQNLLPHLDRALLESMPRVKLVLLKGNPWKCNCHLLNLKLWLERFTFEGGVIDGVFCGMPEPWKGKDLLSIPHELYQPCSLPSPDPASSLNQPPGSASDSTSEETLKSPEKNSEQQEGLECEVKLKPRPVNLRHAVATVVITGVVCGIVCLMMLAAAIYGCTYAAITAQYHGRSLEPTGESEKLAGGKDPIDSSPA